MTLNGGTCILNYCTDELSQGFWPSLLQCRTRKRKILKDWLSRKQDSDYTTTAWNHFARFAVMNNLGVTLVIAIGFKLRWFESRVEKDAERISHLYQCSFIISRTLLNGSLLPVESQLQSSFCLSNISRPLVVLQISTGGLIEFFSLLSSQVVCVWQIAILRDWVVLIICT